MGCTVPIIPSLRMFLLGLIGVCRAMSRLTLRVGSYLCHIGGRMAEGFPHVARSLP